MSKSTRTLSSRLGVSLRRCYFVLSFHPSTVLLVDQEEYPCPIFFVNMGSLRRLYVDAFGRKTVLMLRKRWRSIYYCSVKLPWHVEMKLSR